MLIALAQSRNLLRLSEADESQGALADIQLVARFLGGRNPDYESGIFSVEFDRSVALNTFCDELEGMDCVDTYEIRMASDEDTVEEWEARYTHEASYFKAIVLVYLAEDFIDYGEYEIDDGEVEPAITGDLQEVKRQIKVNSRGTKRIKMKCRPGFKWDVNQKACVKIGGSELATNRRSHRRAVLTKRSQGVAFKKRVLRKTRKALRFRKALGLQGR